MTRAGCRARWSRAGACHGARVALRHSERDAADQRTGAAAANRGGRAAHECGLRRHGPYELSHIYRGIEPTRLESALRAHDRPGPRLVGAKRRWPFSRVGGSHGAKRVRRVLTPFGRECAAETVRTHRLTPADSVASFPPFNANPVTLEVGSQPTFFVPGVFSL